MQEPARAVTRLIAIALAIGGVTACTDTGSSGSRAPLRRAVERTLDQPTLRSERRAAPDEGGAALVEEFIAPDRLRTVVPPPAGFPGSDVSTLPTLLIVVGATSYAQDSRAAPPNNELFVECKQGERGGSEVRGVLALVSRAGEVESVGDNRYRFRLPDNSKWANLSGARGEVAVSRGRVSELRLQLKPDDVEAVWSLTFDEVAPITAPPADQIVRHDCQLTPSVTFGDLG